MTTTMMMGNMTTPMMTTTMATTMTTTMTVAWLQVATKLCNNLSVLLLCLSQVISIGAECKTRFKFYSYGRACHQFQVFIVVNQQYEFLGLKFIFWSVFWPLRMVQWRPPWPWQWQTSRTNCPQLAIRPAQRAWPSVTRTMMASAVGWHVVVRSRRPMFGWFRGPQLWAKILQIVEYSDQKHVRGLLLVFQSAFNCFLFRMLIHKCPMQFAKKCVRHGGSKLCSGFMVVHSLHTDVSSKYPGISVEGPCKLGHQIWCQCVPNDESGHVSLSVQQIHATNKWGRKNHEKTHGFWHASLTDQPNQPNQPNATSHQKSCRERGVSDTPKSRWFAIDCALKNVMECMIRMHYNTQLHTLTRQCSCAKKEPVLLKSCYFGWHGIFFLER